MMRRSARPCIAAIAMLASACSVSPPEEREPSSDPQGLIELIEARVVLPKGSRPLREYTRHYAYSPDGKVVGRFVSGADETKWLADHRDLPLILDGGCSILTIEFDPATLRFDKVACNGVA